jgi:thioredoxin 1
MSTQTRVGAIAVLVAGLAACDGASSRDPSSPASAASATAASSAPAGASSARPVPRLVDLGAGKCIPCKAMAPILEQLRADYAGRLDVVFIDVWQQPEQGRVYGIGMIPTQIFYGADGRELARHEGFIDREQILARWKGLGVEL